MRFPVLLLTLSLGLSLPLASLGRSEGAIQKSWDYGADVRTLVIDADEQDVVFKAGGNRLTGRLVGDNDDVVKTDQQGETVTITVRTDKSWFSWRNRTSRLEFTLPPDLNLEVTTASGAVLIQVSTESLHVRSASGDIEASRGRGDADVDSASGTVRLRGFSGPVKASTLSGDVILEDSEGEIQASTMSGSLKGRDLRPADRSRFTSVNGDVDLALTGGADAYLVRAETVSGDLKIGRQSADRTLTVGQGPEISARSVSGDIRVR